MFLEIYCIVITIVALGLGYICYRLWQETESQDRALNSIHGHMNLIHSMCVKVLEKEVYSDDPVIRAFIDVLKDINDFMYAYDNQFIYDEEPPEASEPFRGYEDEQ